MQRYIYALTDAIAAQDKAAESAKTWRDLQTEAWGLEAQLVE